MSIIKKLTGRLTGKEIDLIKNKEYAKGAAREREEILRLIWQAVESSASDSHATLAKNLFYQIEARGG